MTSFVARCKNAVRDCWRGWSEQDIARLRQSLSDAARSGGILRITEREYRAWPEFHRRAIASTGGAEFHPVLAWVEGRGLRWLGRAD